MQSSRNGGYTLVEVVVACFVFTAGAIGLTAGSAVVGRQLAANQLASRADRLAASRIELVRAGCGSAESGSEIHGPITSRWTVSRIDSVSVQVAGTVTFASMRGARTRSYTATVACQ